MGEGEEGGMSGTGGGPYSRDAGLQAITEPAGADLFDPLP